MVSFLHTSPYLKFHKIICVVPEICTCNFFVSLIICFMEQLKVYGLGLDAPANHTNIRRVFIVVVLFLNK